MSLVCAICGNASLDSQDALSAHLRSAHLKYFPYTCGVCTNSEVTFRTHSKAALFRHSKREHPGIKVDIIYDEDESQEDRLEELLDRCNYPQPRDIKCEADGEGFDMSFRGSDTCETSYFDAMTNSRPTEPSCALKLDVNDSMIEMGYQEMNGDSNSCRSVDSPLESICSGGIEAISVLSAGGSCNSSKSIKINSHRSNNNFQQLPTSSSSGVVKGPVKLVMTEFCAKYARATLDEFIFGSQFSDAQQEVMLEQFMNLFHVRAPNYNMPYDHKTMMKKLTRQVKDRRREIHMECIQQYGVENKHVTVAEAKNCELNLKENFEVLPDYGGPRDTYMIEVRIMHLPDMTKTDPPNYVYCMVINLGLLRDCDRNVQVGKFKYNFFNLYSPSKCAVKLDWLYPKGTFPAYHGFDTKNTRRQCRTEPVDTSLRAPRSLLRKGEELDFMISMAKKAKMEGNDLLSLIDSEEKMKVEDRPMKEESTDGEETSVEQQLNEPMNGDNEIDNIISKAF